jgi:hypothetical protein
VEEEPLYELKKAPLASAQLRVNRASTEVAPSMMHCRHDGFVKHIVALEKHRSCAFGSALACSCLERECSSVLSSPSNRIVCGAASEKKVCCAQQAAAQKHSSTSSLQIIVCCCIQDKHSLRELMGLL